MPIKLDSSRQEKIVAEVSYTFANLGNGVLNPAVKLPANARVLEVINKIEQAFNSGTNDAFVVQSNESSPKAYITVSAALNSLPANLTSRAANTNLGFRNPVPSTIDIRWTGTGTAATTGAGTLIVEYVVDGRTAFAQD
jgi:hypothetical protein